uniref:Uncharacterized protein n=1 Tax=Candidatus Kentrum sp. FM TaxID=2126340 RepID=A0A450VV14_9GAMM|nr:MAG: hypothetical protein BECKFM1743B_GA0114221_1007314 [Candidatus Kentron sp. FM]
MQFTDSSGSFSKTSWLLLDSGLMADLYYYPAISCFLCTFPGL